MSIPSRQLLELVVRPALAAIELGGRDAEALVMGTAGVESDLRWLGQKGGGPAVGLWQMEPATYRDLWDRWLRRHPEITAGLLALGPPDMHRRPEILAGNLYLGAAMCRIKYRQDRHPLPSADDPEGQAGYWKRIYNTHLGAGRPEHYVRAWRNHVQGLV